MNPQGTIGAWLRGGAALLVFSCLTGCMTIPRGYKGEGIPTQDEARKALVSGDTATALLDYQFLSTKSTEGSLNAEYAYALVLDGHPEAAFQQVDRARQISPSDPSVWFFSSRILALTGHANLAAALWPASRKDGPDWIRRKLDRAESNIKGGAGNGKAYGAKPADRFARANALAAQNFLVSASVAFENLIAQKPGDGAAHEGYSMVLEKLGAYELAVKENKQAQALMKNERVRKALAKRTEILETEAKAFSGKNASSSPAQVDPKGRWFLYGGGQLSMGSDATTPSELSGRVGKFFTSYFDAAVNVDYISNPKTAGVTASTSGFDLGLSGRLTPSFETGGLFGIVGARAGFSASGNGGTFSFGMGQRDASGELDLTVDFGSGIYDGVDLTLGYTAYLGGM